MITNINLTVFEKKLKEFEELTAEHARMEKMGEDLRREEAALTLKASLDNPKQLDQLSTVRLKRELVPSKIRQLDDCLVAIDGELKLEFEARIGDLSREIRDFQAGVRNDFERLMRGYLPDSPEGKSILETVLNQTVPIEKSTNSEWIARGAGYVDSGVVRAKNFIKGASSLGQVIADYAKLRQADKGL